MTEAGQNPSERNSLHFREISLNTMDTAWREWRRYEALKWALFISVLGFLPRPQGTSRPVLVLN